jgi:hypothetical protein
MKKAFQIGSVFLLVVALAAIASVFVPAAGSSAIAGKPRFDDFPANQSRSIHFSADEDLDLTGSSPSLHDRERRRLDQMRDWCLLTVLTSSRLSARQVAETAYDLPAIRHEIMRRVASFEYGETRSRVLADGTVIALVPAPAGPGGDLARRDHLAHIADEQRKNLGELPKVLFVFEYELAPAASSARITRRETLAGENLFTAAYGYVGRDVRTLSELQVFMSSVDDLTYARRSRGFLSLGGRRRLRPLAAGELPYGRIGVEEVAAIWRGQQGLKEFQGCGFSLDPHLDMAKVAGIFDSKLAPVLDRLDPAATAQARELLGRKPASSDEAVLREMRFADTLRSSCQHAGDRDACEQYMHYVVWDNSFQAARYEGRHLAGTETGMVLFYTDLLMKLWSFDLADSAPGHGRIQGFPIETELNVPRLFKSEIERTPETRLWLGPLAAGFQVSGKQGSVMFARNTTRVFAKPHDFLSGQDRQDVSEPHIFDRIFIDWWNDHYEEISRYEPQYERLNEIVKWSIVISWLDLDQNSDLLGFLGDDGRSGVPVKRTHYFPQWASTHGDLRFQSWNQIQFDKQASPRADTESLDIVKSKVFPAFGEQRRWEGGVSLASRSAVKDAAVAAERLETLAPTVRRAGMDALRSDLAAGRLRTLEATEFNFKNFSDEAVSTLARAKPSAQLGDAYGALENVGFDRTIRSTADGFLMRTRFEGERVLGDFGDLRIVKGSGGFRVGWEAREIDLGQSLARRVSTSRAPLDTLAASPEVEATIALDNGNAWLVKVRSSEGWIKLASASSDEARVAAGFQARVAGIGDEARAVDVAWLDRTALKTELPESGYLEIPPPRGTARGTAMECCARAPPAGSQEIFFEKEGARIRALRDAEGNTYLRTADLPAGVRLDPSRLLGRAHLEAEDFRLARNLEAGQYREAAEELARDPVAYRARMDRILESELEGNGRLVAGRQFQKALAHARRLIDVHGPLPELTLRKALLETAAGDAESAATTLNAGLRRPIGNAEKFFEEVDSLLVNARTLDERLATRRIADFADWNAYSARSGEITAFEEGGSLELRLQSQTLSPGLAIDGSKLDIAIARGEPFYVPDSPAAANLDPYPSTGQSSLKQMIASRRVSVRELEMADIRHFRPARLREVSTNTTWRLSHGQSVARVAARAGERYVRFNGKSCDDQDRGCRVYLITPAGDAGW